MKKTGGVLIYSIILAVLECEYDSDGREKQNKCFQKFFDYVNTWTVTNESYLTSIIPKFLLTKEFNYHYLKHIQFVLL